jgi:hypothetical protein
VGSQRSEELGTGRRHGLSGLRQRGLVLGEYGLFQLAEVRARLDPQLEG